MKISRMIFVFCFIVLFSNIAQADISVYDAKGQYIGEYMSGSDPYVGSGGTVFIPSLEKVVSFDNSSGNLQSVEPWIIYFTSSDCTGTPYIYSYWSNCLVNIGTAFYTGLKRAIPTDITAVSYLESSTGGTCMLVAICPFQPCPPAPADLPGMIPAQVFKGKLPFNLPVALPLRLEYSR